MESGCASASAPAPHRLARRRIVDTKHKARPCNERKKAPRMTEHYRPFVKRLISSRTLSMKSFAAGLSERPFIVTIATGLTEVGKSTGNIAIGMYLAAWCTIDSGSRVRKRPAASRAVDTCSERVERGHRSGNQDNVMHIDYVTRQDLRTTTGPIVRNRTTGAIKRDGE